MASSPPHYVILFDGICNLCNHTVDFVIRRDPEARFRFASLQSDSGQRLLGSFRLPAAREESVVLVQDGSVFIESDAALRIARGLTGPWRWLAVFLLVPRPLRDFVYRWIARHRYQWFGKRDSCRLPSPEEKSRFLE